MAKEKISEMHSGDLMYCLEEILSSKWGPACKACMKKTDARAIKGRLTKKGLTYLLLKEGATRWLRKMKEY